VGGGGRPPPRTPLKQLILLHWDTYFVVVDFPCFLHIKTFY
jgi:hypothetical protein